MAAIEKGLPLGRKTKMKKDADLRLHVLKKLGRSIPRAE